MPPSLLIPKLSPPALGPALVVRPRLFHRLNESLRQGQVGLISAPAGFGKTTLANSWRQTIEHPVAWLALDREDDEPARFWSYVLAALHQARGAAGRPPAQPTGPSLPGETFLTALINDLCQTAEPLSLILDDYHFIETPAIHQGLAFLLDHLPPKVHLVLITRADPPLPLSRLRARNQLTEIRATHLRFDTAETTVFLNQRLGLNLSATAIAELERRTEGWIAGLQLAALSLRDMDDGSHFIQEFTGTDRQIGGYLLEEVLQRETPPIQDFLLRTSILDQLNGPVCDAVWQGEGESQTVLELLESRNLFIVPLDHRRDKFRYHPLFRDSLRQQLMRRQPALAAALHRRASVWFEQHGAPAQARWHRLQAQAARPFARGATAPGLGRPCPPAEWDPSDPLEPLSDRESEVLQLIAQGLSNSHIAQALVLSLSTVKVHVHHIYDKLGVGSRTQAVAKAQGLGLLATV